MSVAERREVIKDKGFCFNCLCTAHTRNFCPSRKTCIVCDRNHHTLIHVDTNPSHRVSNSRTKNHRPNGDRNRSRACSQHTTPSPERSQETARRRESNVSQTSTRTQPHINERLSRRTRMHVFLPTAMARILTAQGPEKTRLLFNSGEVHTQILKRLVDRLHLRTIKKDNKDYCTVNLQSYHDSSAKIQVVGLVKDNFNTNLSKSTTEIKLQSIYDHVTDLADPHFFQPKNIEIILANDYLPRVMKAGLIQTTSTTPMAQSTIFGWVISGGCQY